MNYCTWQPDGDGYRCPACTAWRRAKVRRVCRSDAEQQAAIREHNEAKRQARATARERQRVASVAQFHSGNHLARWRLIGRWLKAMGRFAWGSIKARRMLVREEREYLRVRAICEACEEWQPNLEQCKICGCGGRSKVVLLNKLRIESEQCPQGKW